MPDKNKEKTYPEIERRKNSFCPAHESTMKGLVSWKVFALMATFFLAFTGYTNYNFSRETERMQNDRIKSTAEINNSFKELKAELLTDMKRVVHYGQEVALNQQRVMKKIKLEYQKIPYYDETP